MEKQIQTEGIILRRIAFGDADQILTVLTKELGKLSCIAKGSRKITSKFCGRLEMLYKVSLGLYRGRNLEAVREAEIETALPTVDLGVEGHGILFFIAEVTQKLIQDHQQVEGVYSLLEETLTHFNHVPSTEVLLHAYLIKLFTLTGFLGPWDTCPYSNEKHDLSRPLYFSLENAGVVAQNDARPEDVRLPSSIVKWINFIQKYPLAAILKVTPDRGENLQTWQVIQTILRDLLRSPLNSEVFLEQTI